jgi:hypothetical protein
MESMEWWREEIRKDDPFGIPYIFLLIGFLVAETLIPLIVIAVAMSFIMPVGPWVAFLAVIAGWPIQWRLAIDAAIDATFGARVGTAALWAFGAFLVGHLLGPLPATVVIVAASPNIIWAIGRLEDFNLAAEEVVDDALIDAETPRRPPSP